MLNLRNIFILFLIFSILRVFLIPLGGVAYAATLAGGLNILMAFLFFIFLKDNAQIFCLKIYALIMLLPTFFELGVLNSLISFSETLSPIIIFSGLVNEKIIEKFNLNSNLIKKVLIFLIFILLIGHFLTFLGIPLPSINNTPISTWGTGSVDIQKATSVKIRISSFVGSPGPYSMAIAYLFIAFSILKKKYKNFILIIGTFVQLLSFSRSGFAVIVFYFISSNYKIFKILISKLSSKIPKKIFFMYFLLIIVVFTFSIVYRDIIIAQFNRILYLLSIQTDIANVDRLQRMELSRKVIFDSFYSFICGSGTGITSRSVGGEQYESQLIKVFVEWGLLGFIIYGNWILCTFRNIGKIGYKKYNLNYLPLFITVLFNLSFIQALTSSPIISSIGLAILSNKLVNLEEKKSF